MIVAPSTKRTVTMKTLTVRRRMNVTIVQTRTWKAPVEAQNLLQQNACINKNQDMLTLRKMTRHNSDLS